MPIADSGIDFCNGNAIPAAVSIGVVTPTVIVQIMKDIAYIAIPVVPERDKPSRIEMSELFKSDIVGM